MTHWLFFGCSDSSNEMLVSKQVAIAIASGPKRSEAYLDSKDKLCHAHSVGQIIPTALNLMFRLCTEVHSLCSGCESVSLIHRLQSH